MTLRPPIQAVIETQPDLDPDRRHWRMVLFNEDGTPFTGSPGDGGSGSPTREDVTGTLVALAADAEGNLTLALGKGYTLYKIITNQAARVRLYASAAYRAADAARPIGTDPTGDHGLLMEIVTTAEQLSYALTPPVQGANLEDPVTGDAVLRVTNLDATGDVVVTLTKLTTEV
jgi:hypothetical protein